MRGLRELLEDRAKDLGINPAGLSATELVNAIQATRQQQQQPPEEPQP